MQGHDDYRQQAAQYPNYQYLINANATHDMNKSLPAASQGMYAQSVAGMAGAGPHHQPGATSVVQQSQMNHRPMLMANMQTRANPPMPNMSRNPMGNVNQGAPQGGPGSGQYQHVQNVVLQSHAMHGSMSTQPGMVLAAQPMFYPEAQGVPLQVRKFHPRPAVSYPPTAGHQQYYISHCFNYQTAANTPYYQMPHMQSCPPPVSNMPESQPQQSTKEKKVIPIINPDTGKNVLEELHNTNSDIKDTPKQGNSEAAAQFASQVAAAVASRDPAAHRLSEDSMEPEAVHLENKGISETVSDSGSGGISTPEICDPYVDDELSVQENATYLYPGKDRIEADSITDSIVELEPLCVVSSNVEAPLMNHEDLIDKPSIPEDISPEVTSEGDVMQQELDMPTNSDVHVEEFIMPQPMEVAEEMEAVVPLAEDALASSNKVSDVISSISALKLEKSPVEGRKSKPKKKKELNKKGDSKEGGEMDAFCIDEDSTGTPTSPPPEVEPPPVPVSSSVPSVTSQSSMDRVPDVDGPLLNSLPPAADEVEKPEEEMNDVQTPEDLSVISDDVLSEKKEDDDDSDKVILKYSYKENQWSPLNPEGKKQYDRDFLLKMQSQPMSMKKPDNLPKLDVIKDKAQLHKLNEVNRMPTAPMPPRMGIQYDPFIPLFARPQQKPPHPGIRRSQQGREKPKKVVAFSSSLNQTVKLHESQNAWKPGHKDEVVDSPEIQELYKRVRGILNKLTPQKFDTLLTQVKDLEINTEERLNGVIDLVFEKAIDEPNFSVPYANMCKQLALLKVNTDEEGQQVAFRKLLLTKCQKEFEQDRNEELRRTERLQQIETCENNDQKKQWQEELDEEDRKNKRRQLGNIRFIGELFKLGMLVEPIMHDCIKKLLMQKDEDSLECLCRLLMTIGKELETRSKGSESAVSEKKDMMDFNFNEMQKIVDKRKTTSRVRFMLQDVIDLRKRNWVPRRDEDNPKTIDQIHRDVEREAHEKQQMFQNMTFTPKRLPEDNRRKLPNSGRGSSGYEDGWITSNKGSKANSIIDPTKLKITKPQEVDTILLGPGAGGRGFTNWSRGSSGGGYRSSMESESKPPLSNRYNALSDQQSSDSRRGFQRSNQGASSRENSRGRMNQVSSHIRKTPSITKDRENVIEAVSMMSRTGQPEQKVPEAAKVPDMQNVNGKDNADNASIFTGSDLKEEDVKRKTKSLMDEFLLNNDIKEATRCIIEMASATTVHLFVTEAINQVLERSSQSRHLFGKLLHSLVKSTILTMEQYNKGMESVLQYVDDFVVDIPKVFEYLGEIMEPMFEGNPNSLLEIKDTIKICIPSMSAGKLMSGILNCAAKTRGAAKMSELWLESGIQWTDILPPKSDIDEFIKKEQVEFTMCPIKSEPIPMPIEEVKKKLAYFMSGVDNNNEMVDWIDAHIGEERCEEPTFVRALVIAVFEKCITGSADVCELSTEELQTRMPLLKRYVTVKQDLQLQALYAIQALMNQLDQPKGVLRSIFDILYDDDIVTEEVFKRWDVSTDPAEQAGRGVARSLVASFFTWLREGDEEDSEDG